VAVVPAKSRKVRNTAAAIALIAVAAATGGLVSRLAGGDAKPSYLGKDASTVAADLNCAKYSKAAKHDESVYKYRDQGTCTLDGTAVTITTFNSVADGAAFATLMRGLIPVLHPTWVGAAYAAGDGWSIADTTNLSPKVAETAVKRLGTGAVHILPSTKK
jgi:hypothetical protein